MRRALALLAAVPLGLLYLLGAGAGLVVVAVLVAIDAVRLGWTDVRKRGSRGTA